LATVLATPVPTTTKAMKLKKALNGGAHFAGMARVATTVATEFAASWKPLVKSNRKASATSAMTEINNTSTYVPHRQGGQAIAR
jgi:hypothetical protein